MYDRIVLTDRVVRSLWFTSYRRAVTVTGPTQRDVLLKTSPTRRNAPPSVRTRAERTWTVFGIRCISSE